MNKRGVTMKNSSKTTHFLSHILMMSVILMSCLNLPLHADITPSSSNITVCSTHCNFATIQAAINDSETKAGAIITLLDPVYTEAGIVIDKDFTIQGQEGSERPVIQAHADVKNAKNRVFLVKDGTNVTFRNIVIQHGFAPRSYPPSGGAICNYGTLTLENCLIRNNRATDGGGILNKGNITLKNCTLSNNTADGIHQDAGLRCGAGGAIKSETGQLTLINCTVSGNEATEDGGGIFVACKTTATFVNSIISENTAAEDGGGIHLRGTLVLNYSTISQNMANRWGGGIYIHGKLEFSNNIITNNTRSDCYLVTHHPYKGVGTIVTNINNLIADQSCHGEYAGDPK